MATGTWTAFCNDASPLSLPEAARWWSLMPLVVLSGQPASGKSAVAEQLVKQFVHAGHAPVLIDEPSLHLDRNGAYSSTQSSDGLIPFDVRRLCASGC
jgi:hypothetical protein